MSDHACEPDARCLDWPPEEDQELVHGPGTVLDRAIRLRRTYLACTARLARLRDAGLAPPP